MINNRFEIIGHCSLIFGHCFDYEVIIPRSLLRLGIC